MIAARQAMTNRHQDFPWHRTDRLIASYPRSGSTWVRAVVSYILARQVGDPDAYSLARLPKYTPDIYRHQMPQRPGRIIKTHSVHVPAFRRLRVVYLVRHVFDVAPSFYRLQIAGQAAGDVPGFPEFVRDVVCGDGGLFAPWQEHVDSWMIPAKAQRGKHISFVRYEDLRDDPRRFSVVLDFLQIGYSAKMLAEAIDVCSLERMQSQAEDKAEFEHVCDSSGQGAFFNAGQAGRYRYMLTDADRALILEHCGDLLKELGYTED